MNLVTPKTQTPEVLDICLYLLGYHDITPIKKEVVTGQWGFKGKCIKVLAKTLEISESRVWHWGPTLDFEEIPAAHKAALINIYLQRKLADQEKLIQQQRREIRQLKKAASFRSA